MPVRSHVARFLIGMARSCGTALSNESANVYNINVIKSKTWRRKWYHDARQAQDNSHSANCWLAKLRCPARYPRWPICDFGPRIWMGAARNWAWTRCSWKYRWNWKIHQNCAAVTATRGKNENVPPPGGLAAASILWNQTAGFSGIYIVVEITHQPVHLLALALFAIFDLIIRLNLARFRSRNEEHGSKQKMADERGPVDIWAAQRAKATARRLQQPIPTA